jgi:hypothetical protein
MLLKLCLITADVDVCKVAGLIETFAPLGYYAAYVDRWLLTFRKHIGPSSSTILLRLFDLEN